MKLLVANVSLLLIAAILPVRASAQDAADAGKSNDSKLDVLVKKMDEQNTKIDTLSQQILKLEQQIANIRPGVMIGESTPAAAPAQAQPATASASPPSGNAHVVAKGETLTSIAKTHKVGVGELQKFNHIENDRALQIGQTIMIPTPGGASASPSPSSPNQ
ncbi:MAG TPA: LysM domain-containing protein [Thermoanaerobaculia bacterium]